MKGDLKDIYLLKQAKSWQRRRKVTSQMLLWRLFEITAKPEQRASWASGH